MVSIEDTLRRWETHPPRKDIYKFIRLEIEMHFDPKKGWCIRHCLHHRRNSQSHSENC